jgi:acetylornithine deacetylase/succinyl-diaminopimelate desuccinylase-like protein
MAIDVLHRIAPDYPAPVAMLCVSDEENGGSGATHVLKAHGHRFGTAPVIGEGGAGIAGLPILPGNVPIFAIATAEKSSLWLKLVLEVPASGHGSVPPLEYANRQMVLALNRLLTDRLPLRLVPASRTLLENLSRYHNFPKNFFLSHPEWPLVKKVLDNQLAKEPLTSAIVRDTATLIGLETEPGASNAIPRRVVARLDCRLLPGTGETPFLGHLRERLGEPRIKIEVQKRSPASPGTEPGTVYAALEGAVTGQEANALVSPMVFPASSDGNAFRLAGHEFYGLFPCRLERAELEAIHGVDERLSEASLEQAVRVLVETILRLRYAGAGR